MNQTATIIINLKLCLNTESGNFSVNKNWREHIRRITQKHGSNIFNPCNRASRELIPCRLLFLSSSNYNIHSQWLQSISTHLYFPQYTHSNLKEQCINWNALLSKLVFTFHGWMYFAALLVIDIHVRTLKLYRIINARDPSLAFVCILLQAHASGLLSSLTHSLC
jgi:hypothetical protein